ncbi:MAG TPA: hypothetical protein VLA36_06445 [Longimicrobiales bacterium]|nr:hypothetical protein [Longimicrobiales bacterium]
MSFAADLAAAPGAAFVRVEYELSGVRPGDSVPVSVLDFGRAVAEDFRVGARGVPMELSGRHGAARSGSWPVAAGAEGRAVLAVTYQVPGAGEDEDGRIVSHLPVLIVDRAPEEARPGFFRGSVQVPADWRVTEGFPTGLASGGEAGRYDVELSVLPAVVTLRARSDGRRTVALPLALDLVALSVLLITAVAGWRHMREPVL